MDRRALIQWMVATGGLAAINRLSSDDIVSIGEEVHSRSHLRTASLPSAGSLNAHELRTVAIAAERIIPATDTPGATDAGVAAFIDLMLTEWYPEMDQRRFRTGVADLDVRSRVRTRRAFVDATSSEQSALLEVLDSEVSTLRRARSPGANDHWFAMLKYLTVWGYCTSEVGMRKTLHSFPPAMRYDGAASVS